MYAYLSATDHNIAQSLSYKHQLYYMAHLLNKLCNFLILRMIKNNLSYVRCTLILCIWKFFVLELCVAFLYICLFP